MKLPLSFRGRGPCALACWQGGAGLVQKARVVVFRPGALGDTVLTAEALYALRRGPLDRHVEMVGNPEAGGLLQAAGLVDAVTSFDHLEVAALFGTPPVVAARWHGASLVVLWLAKAERIAAAFHRAGVHHVLAATPQPPGHTRHIADHLVHTLLPAGIRSQPGSALLPLLSQRHMARAKAPGRALLHPGSGSKAKNWAAENYAVIAHRLLNRGWEVTFLRGPADEAPVAQARAAVRQQVATIAPPGVAELASALQEVGLWVGNDSGVAHLSARLGTPTVAIFGPTDPRQWAPRGPRVAVSGGRGRWPTVDAVEGAIDHLTQADEGEHGRL